MERYVGKVAIVTGASSGIGKTIAEYLTRAGMKVVGLARRVELIQENAEELEKSGVKGKLYAIKCDLLIEDEILKMFEWTTNNVGPVQVLVNNAGVAFASYLYNGVTSEWRQMFDTHVLGMCITNREAIKIMTANNIEGHIININGTDGHQHLYVPYLGAGSASRHAITNLTEILRREMVEMKTNIKVTSLSPGLVNTEIIAKGNFSQESVDLLGEMEPLETQDIADAVLYILSVPRRVQINEITLRSLNSTL